MTQRLLRTVPAAVLLTTALSWNLPALAQTSSGTGTGTRPPSGSSAAPAATSPGTTPERPSSGTGGSGDAHGLPGDLRPAMPASGASAAQDGAAVRSMPQRQHRP